MTDYIINTYFKHPSYHKINGAPYFSIYELYRFMDGMGSKEAAKKALQLFREKTIKAGFKDLHLNTIVWGVQILPNETVIKDPSELISYLGFQSITSYVWIHHVGLNDFPKTEYKQAQEAYFKEADRFANTFKVPYFINITMGRDASPRCSDKVVPFANLSYPCMATLTNNTPKAFKEALLQGKNWSEAHVKGTKVITINSWNEWTEGSFLEPERQYGYQYLDAIKEVFKK